MCISLRKLKGGEIKGLGTIFHMPLPQTQWDSNTPMPLGPPGYGTLLLLLFIVSLRKFFYYTLSHSAKVFGNDLHRNVDCSLSFDAQFRYFNVYISIYNILLELRQRYINYQTSVV